MAGTLIRGALVTTLRDTVMKQEDRRKKLFKQLPAGNSPFTKYLMMLPSKPARRSIVQWGQRAFNAQLGDITDVYTDVALSAAYASGGVVGTPLYLKVTADDAKQFKVNQQVYIWDPANYADIAADVRAVQVASDTTSYVQVNLLEADGDSILANTDLVWRIGGNAQAELSGLPSASYREPEWTENYAQIFMEACEASGTELAEEDIVSPNAYEQSVQDSFDALRIQMERTYLRGVGSKTLTDPNTGRPRFMMNGLLTVLKAADTAGTSNNIFNFSTDTDFTGYNWLEAGWDFLKKIFLEVSRYSSNRKKMLVGDLAWLAINNLIEDYGSYKWEPMDDEFGIRIRKLYGLTVDVDIVPHPLWKIDPAHRRAALIFEPELLEYAPMVGRDIQFIKQSTINKQTHVSGHTWLDGKKEGWFGQATLRYHNLPAMAYVDALGEDNSL